MVAGMLIGDLWFLEKLLVSSPYEVYLVVVIYLKMTVLSPLVSLLVLLVVYTFLMILLALSSII